MQDLPQACVRGHFSKVQPWCSISCFQSQHCVVEYVKERGPLSMFWMSFCHYRLVLGSTSFRVIFYRLLCTSETFKVSPKPVATSYLWCHFGFIRTHSQKMSLLLVYILCMQCTITSVQMYGDLSRVSKVNEIFQGWFYQCQPPKGFPRLNRDSNSDLLGHSLTSTQH